MSTSKEVGLSEDEGKEAFNLRAPQPDPPHPQSRGAAGGFCSASGTQLFAREF